MRLLLDFFQSSDKIIFRQVKPMALVLWSNNLRIFESGHS